MTVVVRQFVLGVAYVLDALLDMYWWILLVAVLLNWVRPDPRMPVVRFLYAVTEPVLAQVRRRLPFVVAGGIDFSPIVVMLGIQFLQILIVRSLYDLARQIGSTPALPFGG